MSDNPTMPDWLEPLEHTADTGILVRAQDLPELFARSAWGMFAIITEPSGIDPREAEPIQVRAPDKEALMVRWLSELNFRHVTRHYLYGRFKIERMTSCELQGRIFGEPIDPDRHVIHTEIKAVTFHGLTLESGQDGWRAQIIFDL